MHQQLWGYEVEEKLYLGVREQKRLNTNDVKDTVSQLQLLEKHIFIVYELNAATLMAYITICKRLFNTSTKKQNCKTNNFF
jgi:hypothetical protein